MKPEFCILGMTDKCMLKCKMCYIWRENAAHSSLGLPNIHDWKRFITSLRRFIPGDLYIHFAGGEALLNNITLELIDYTSNLGFSTLLNTNAYLINKETAKQINKARLRCIYISLDSLKEDTHDFLRGVTGVYGRLMNAIQYLHSYAPDLQIKLNAVIMEKNLDDLVDLAKWVIQDRRISAINFQAITQPLNIERDDYWYEKSEHSFLWPKDIKKVESVLDELIRLKQGNKFKIDNLASQFIIYKSYFNNPRNLIKKLGCHMYKYEHAINVSAYGQVHICFDMPSIGNIKEESFNIKKIWHSPQADLIRGDIKNCKKNCLWMVNCNYDEQELYAV